MNNKGYPLGPKDFLSLFLLLQRLYFSRRLLEKPYCQRNNYHKNKNSVVNKILKSISCNQFTFLYMIEYL